MASEEESETATVLTEPSAGDEQREAYGPMRVASKDPRVARYREWWRANPLNNLFPFPKPSLWRRFNAEVVEGKTPEEASLSGANVTLDDLKRCVVCVFVCLRCCLPIAATAKAAANC
jgi:hypothetical protein